MNRADYQILNQEQRVKFLEKLREIVARRSPKNKVGSPIISDFDLLTCSDEEFFEAAEKTS